MARTASRPAPDRVLGYLPPDVPPPGALVSLGFQHVLTMFPATALVAIITGFDVAVTVFASGLATIVAGIALAREALDMATDNWTIALITLVLTIMFSVYLRGLGLLGMLPVLLGAVCGYIIAAFAGDVTFSPVAEAAWFSVPAFQLPAF